LVATSDRKEAMVAESWTGTATLLCVRGGERERGKEER